MRVFAEATAPQMRPVSYWTCLLPARLPATPAQTTRKHAYIRPGPFRPDNGLPAGHWCHPVLMDVSLPDQLGVVGRESSAAASAVVGKLNLSAPPKKITGQTDVAFVPVTRAQWKSVLRDADLPGLQQETDEIVAEILRLRTTSGRAVGKELPQLLRCLRASVVAIGAAAEEVCWFSPSRTSAAERRMATDLA